jgi:hypothetical protein
MTKKLKKSPACPGLAADAAAWRSSGGSGKGAAGRWRKKQGAATYGARALGDELEKEAAARGHSTQMP